MRNRVRGPVAPCPWGLTSRLSSALGFAADGVSVANGAFGEALARDDRWAQPSRADSGNKRRHNALRLPLITAKIERELVAYTILAGRNASRCVRSRPRWMWNGI